MLKFMRTFYGGQIDENSRGDLAVVVSREKAGTEMSPDYHVFVVPLSSDVFIQLTGMYDARGSTDRVYIGVSSDVGNRVAARVGGKNKDSVDLRSVDREVVGSYFLDKYPETQPRIVLQRTSAGYVEVPDEKKDELIL